jgi:hypothetical protein
MSEEKGLTIVEQKHVAFYGDEVLAVRTEDGSVFIPVRPICCGTGAGNIGVFVAFASVYLGINHE